MFFKVNEGPVVVFVFLSCGHSVLCTVYYISAKDTMHCACFGECVGSVLSNLTVCSGIYISGCSGSDIQFVGSYNAV